MNNVNATIVGAIAGDTGGTGSGSSLNNTNVDGNRGAAAAAAAAVAAAAAAVASTRGCNANNSTGSSNETSQQLSNAISITTGKLKNNTFRTQSYCIFTFCLFLTVVISSSFKLYVSNTFIMEFSSN